MKSFGNTFANSMISSLGQLPAPYVYGAILNLNKQSKAAFNFTMLISWLGIFFIAITAYFRYKIPDEEEEEKELEKKEVEIAKVNSKNVEIKRHSIVKVIFIFLFYFLLILY